MIILRYDNVRHYMLCDLIDVESPEFEEENHVKVFGPHIVGDTGIRTAFVLDTVYMLTFDSQKHEDMFKMKYSEYL